MTAPPAYAAVLAGGRGERFWPLSTAREPKQFLRLLGEGTMLAQAVDRLDGCIPPERTFVITHRDHLAVARAAAPRVPAEQVVGEPVGRDTAAAVALACALAARRDPDAGLAVVTADHAIGDLPLFRRTLADGLDLARREQAPVVIGMRPDHPATGFGYIETGEPGRVSGQGTRFFPARRFVEKPGRETAERYLESGRFYWNAGMFLWTVPVLREAFEQHQPMLARLIHKLMKTPESQWEPVLRNAYAGLDKLSIDYALMEKMKPLWMAEGRFAWDDVGSWTAWARHTGCDAAGNTARGRVEILDGADNIVVCDEGLTALLGVRGLIVVRAGPAVLVCARERAQDIKRLVEALAAREDGRDVL